MRRARTAIAGVVLSWLGVLALSPGWSAAASTDPLFRFADTRIVESSGLAISSYGDGIVYTHNDSGDSARFFAVDPQGATIAVYTLRGAINVDWEDMASGTDSQRHPVLYFADIGDNARSRTEIDVYRVGEPRGPSADVPWVRYRFGYPDGAHDAETLLVDPRTHRMYIATKSLIGDGELYAAPTVLSTSELNVLTPLRAVPPLTTSGDFSPDGSRIVLLTYLRAYWATGVDGSLHGFDVPLQPQDEAIAFTRDGASALVGSEGLHSAVFRVALPGPAPVESLVPRSSSASAVSAGAPSSGPATPQATSTSSRGDSTGWWVAIAGGFAGVAAVVAVVRWIRRRGATR
jgi:hypothetical protein